MEARIKTLLIFLAIASIFMHITPLQAQYFPPVPPVPIIVRETFIIVSYVEPQYTITINVTQFDPLQVVKSLTITFIEPILTASLEIYHLKQKPPEVPNPPDVALLYFTIRAHEALLKNVKKAVIVFAVEKAIVKEKGVDVETVVLNRFVEAWEELPTRRVEEDVKFFFFEAESPGLSHFAATGVAPPPFPWWIIAVVIVVAVVAGIYLYRKRKLMA